MRSIASIAGICERLRSLSSAQGFRICRATQRFGGAMEAQARCFASTGIAPDVAERSPVALARWSETLGAASFRLYEIRTESRLPLDPLEHHLCDGPLAPSPPAAAHGSRVAVRRRRPSFSPDRSPRLRVVECRDPFSRPDGCRAWEAAGEGLSRARPVTPLERAAHHPGDSALGSPSWSPALSRRMASCRPRPSMREHCGSAVRLVEPGDRSGGFRSTRPMRNASSERVDPRRRLRLRASPRGFDRGFDKCLYLALVSFLN
jgi:hypothetical protein